jgi:hypothetical protein
LPQSGEESTPIGALRRLQSRSEMAFAKYTAGVAAALAVPTSSVAVHVFD